MECTRVSDMIHHSEILSEEETKLASVGAQGLFLPQLSTWRKGVTISIKTALLYKAVIIPTKTALLYLGVCPKFRLR